MMSKKILDNSELQKLTISPTSTCETENLPFLKMTITDPSTNEVSKVTNITTTHGQRVTVSAQNSNANATYEKKKVEKTHSGPVSASRIPSFRLSTPNSQGYTRVSYTNEKKVEHKKMEKQSPPPKRESSSIFSRPSKSSIKHSPLLRLNREEKKSTRTPPSKPPDYQYVRSRNLSPDGVNRVRGGIGALRNLRGGYLSPLRLMDRPTQHHTFPTDDTDVREIEKKLLQLMEDFEAGNLRAFGKDSRLRQMEEIREQQERLARLHFEVGADQELYSPLSEDGLKNAEDNMKKLMNKLAHLSESIENLHSNSDLDRKPTNTERKLSMSALHTLSSSSSLDSSIQPDPAESTILPKNNTPLVVQSNSNKTIHSPPLPPPPNLPSQISVVKVKDQIVLSNQSASATCSKASTSGIVFQKYASRSPVDDNSTQLPASPITTNIQKNTSSSTPVNCCTTNIQPVKLVSQKIPPSGQSTNQMESELSQNLRNPNQGGQPINKKNDGNS